MMNWTESRYMSWAKAMVVEPTTYELTQSGMPARSWADLPVENLPMTSRSPYGHPGLRQLIADHHGVTADRVLVAAGTSQANFLVVAAAADAGDTVILECPTYEPLQALFASLGVRVETLTRRPDQGFAPDLEGISSVGRARLVVLTDPHNPSGRILTASHLDALREAAARRGALLVLDQVYRDFLDEAAAPPMVDHEVRTASLTKVYGLGALRIGWAVGPRALIARAEKIQDLLDVVLPPPMQELAYRVLRERAAYRRPGQEASAQGKPIIEAWVRSRGLAWSDPGAGIIGTLALPQGWTAPNFVDRLVTEHDARVVPGDFFGLPGWVRVGFGLPPGILVEGLSRVGQLLDSGPEARP